jgi:AcrR family transcriptional regulator
VAEAAGVSPGTITHHFPPQSKRPRGSLPYAALQRALDRVGNFPVEETADILTAAAAALDDGDPDAADDIARALEKDMLAFSPDGGPSDPVVESEEIALFLAAAAGPHDPIAAQVVRDFCKPMRATYEAANERLLAATRRRFRLGVDGASFAVIQEALCDGFIWIRRFDPDAAPTRMFTDAWMRLFEACTLPAATFDEGHSAESVFRLPEGSKLDPDKRAAIAVAAARVYDSRGWDGLTVLAVAEEAGVSRPTVVAHFGDRNGLAAAVWTRHIPGLRAEADRDSGKPVHIALTNHLRRITEIARVDRYLTAAFLEGVFGYTVKHGVPRLDDPADPRNLVPLPSLIEGLIQQNSKKFRAGYADTPLAVADTAALLTNTGMHLAMTRPAMRAWEIADRVRDTMLAGMLRTRPTH